MTTTDNCEEAHKGASVALWRAVISQAFADACSDNKEATLDRQQARIWLEGNSPDFAEVCALALLEPDHVRRLAAKHIEEHENPKPKPVKQADLTKRGKAVIYTFDGKSMTLKDWSEHIGVSVGTLQSRLARGESLQNVFNPITRRRGRQINRRIPQ